MKTPRSPRSPPAVAESKAAPQLVVGIGASAGGLKALQQFVQAVPADSGMAFVVITHLDPRRESRMGELLQDCSAIPVSQVSGPTVLAANHIYIIPPGHDLAMRQATLELRDRGERSNHAPVDLFFRTLAEAYGAEAVGVVLSGTGADGASGIRYIREAGGITIAQSPGEAEYDGMPASAIATGLIDLVLPSAQMPAQLLRLRRLPRHEETTAETPDGEGTLAEILATLRLNTGHDFSLYKRTTVLRRLDRRLRFNDVATLEAYHTLLQGSATECQALLRDLLISVSSFFRDPDAFEALAALAPGLFAGKGRTDTVRVWVVGCATGEEVYSIAMVLAEHAATLEDPPAVQLFATDIDERGYAWARAGFYSAAATAGIAPERLQQFFTRENGGYRIAKALREQVLFAGHNVLHDPPFSRIDLVSCRNLFIYLQPEAQKRALETFHFALNPDGLLFLGASETLDESGLFAPAVKEQRLFRRSGAPHRIAPRLAAADPLPAPRIAGAVPATAAAPGTVSFPYGALHLRMLEQYAPASVVVNQRLDVLHLSASAGRFLRLGEGEPSHNLLGLAGEELRKVLRTALHQAFEQGVSSTRRIGMDIEGRRRTVSIQVRAPASTDAAPERYALVVFELEKAPAPEPSGERPPVRSQDAELEEEVRRTRELLESTTAAHDRTVAELQTVNEELQSINEEQKAASEELETSREEIQSVNEELTTINQEHQSTIDELKRTNADLQNLIESTEIGTIFLDRKLRIRLFTPGVATLFNFVSADQGRPFSHITHRLRYDELHEHVARVLSNREHIEREVPSDAGAWFIVRMSPYRSLDGGYDGVVLTFFDNTAQHLAAEELRQAKLEAESANVAKGAFLSTLSHEFRTPLNAILGYADLLSIDGALNAAQKLKIERIKTGGWHLAAMIEDILTFTRLDGGHVVVDSATVDACALAADVGALAEPAAAAKQLSFVLDVPDAAVSLVTDAGKVRQILVNLCENAVKFTTEGEVSLRLSADHERVTFAVSDTGIGIEPEHQSHIFERFWQVNGSSTRSAGGLGIGLASAREYARLLGGDVTVESVTGSGSTFRVWLPRQTES